MAIERNRQQRRFSKAVAKQKLQDMKDGQYERSDTWSHNGDRFELEEDFYEEEILDYLSKPQQGGKGVK